MFRLERDARGEAKTDLALGGENDQRVLRLAINRLGEKGEWNLDELKIEFEGAPSGTVARSPPRVSRIVARRSTGLSHEDEP